MELATSSRVKEKIKDPKHPWNANQPIKRSNAKVVGSFNPFQKHARQILVHFPR